MTPMEAVEVGIVIGGYAVTILLLPRVVLARRESAATMSWILLLIFVPGLGALVYWVFGERRLKRFVRKRRGATRRFEVALPAGRLKRSEAAESKLDETDRELITIITKLCDDPPLGGNRIEHFSDPDEASATMLQAIGNARTEIHFSVYLFRPDEAGTAFRDALAAAARRGVKVRLLIDDVGSLWTRESFFNVLREAGGELAVFLPVSPIRGLYHANLRNHRKILIIDGNLAFTGGLNVGNEYGGLRRRRFGPWRDTHLAVRGPAVAAIQDVFLEDWFFVTNKEVDHAEAFPPLEPAGDAFLHVVPSGPDSDWEVIHHAIFTIITKARHHVYLTTPYFVPDRALLVALQTAALRGVDVRLLLPSRSDHAVVFAAGHFHYQELLRAGVRIFEYTKGMLHAKTVEVDGRFSTIGSANLDLRSFRLNFELNIVAYDARAAEELRLTFLRDLESSNEVGVERVDAWSLQKRLGIATAKLFEGIL
ncbi:MAG: cardiolipin synthase [Planctomycetes bacterium]|nr:cardiolipin synthase [Planctomycetota bacterium]